jgi:hypothetical protein
MNFNYCQPTGLSVSVPIGKLVIPIGLPIQFLKCEIWIRSGFWLILSVFVVTGRTVGEQFSRPYRFFNPLGVDGPMDATRKWGGLSNKVSWEEPTRIQRERNGAHRFGKLAAKLYPNREVYGGHRFGKLAAKLYPNREEEGGRRWWREVATAVHRGAGRGRS